MAGATDKSRIEQLEYDLEMAKADARAAEESAHEKDVEISELKNRVQDLTDELDDAEKAARDRDEDDEFVASSLMSEMRRLVYRKQYEDAIELADRELPSRYRYAC